MVEIINQVQENYIRENGIVKTTCAISTIQRVNMLEIRNKCNRIKNFYKNITLKDRREWEETNTALKPDYQS